MGRAGRFACIFLPMALTLASLICIILVGLGGTNKSSSTLDNLYFLKANTTSVSSDISSIISTATSEAGSEASAIASEAAAEINMKDFYTVYYWNYCDGTISDNKTTYDSCSSRKAAFWFNPLEVWNLNTTISENALPSSLKDGLKTYEAVSKWMFVAYIIAFVATAIELIIGCFAILSRWGSLVTMLISIFSFVFVLAASLTSTIMFSVLKGILNHDLKKYGVVTSMGSRIYVTTWLACAFSLGAAMFWLLSTCCCSGRSEKTVRAHNATYTPYTYERMESPFDNQVPKQRQGDVQMTPMAQTTSPYEPYRHENL